MATKTPKVPFDWESRKPWLDVPFPEDEYRERIARTRKLMTENGFDALLAIAREAGDATVRWLSNFTPFLGQAAIVLHPEGEPVLIAEMAMHGEPMHTLFNRTWFRDARLVPAGSSITAEVVKALGGGKSIRRLGVIGFREMPVYWAEGLKDGLAGCELKSADQEILRLRAIKSPREIEKMRSAAQISGLAIKAAMDACRPGASEFQVAGIAHQVMFTLGAEGLAFDSAVVAGPRAGLKHGYPSGRLMQNGDMVFIDMAAQVDGYHADLSRTIVVGEPDDYQRRMLVTAEKLFEVWMQRARPGVAVNDIKEECTKIAHDAGFEEEHQPLGWGHGLGVSLFELPFLGGPQGPVNPDGGTVLQEGNIFALEPMLVKLGVGTAVVEDTMLITHDGIEALSGLTTKIYS
ncbi:MAG TPA: Xaa-Pro peptidase family protein [Candidatus Dormibacteraeota bacterium]|nr:Xaa-Pro peptidase family protein [Candidatus Dormibacteraeota bacterium]